MQPYTGNLISKSSTLRRALGLERTSSQQKPPLEVSAAYSSTTTLEALVNCQLHRVCRRPSQCSNSTSQVSTKLHVDLDMDMELPEGL